MKPKFRINSPLYVTKRMNISKRNAWLIRGGAILLSFLLAGVISTLLAPGSFGTFYKSMFDSVFGDASYILDLFCCVAIYLLLSLAITPAFKMKFWNIGAEGQALMGCVVTAVILLKVPASVPGPLVIIMALIGGVGAGIVWALIPTLCKIKFNTNETLFTLMMNYVATPLTSMTIAMCALGGSQKFPVITDTSRLIISIGGVNYLPIIVIAILLTVFMIFYLTKSKHGFELSVLGDSTNTARYAGMNIKKITIRTMIISGAIAGLVGFLLVCGHDAVLNEGLVGGKGFTAVLISWLGHFNPSEIALYSFLIGFFDHGTRHAATIVGVSDVYFSALIIGLFILIVVTSEFFVRYKVNIRRKEAKITQAPTIEKKEVAPVVKAPTKAPIKKERKENKMFVAVKLFTKSVNKKITLSKSAYAETTAEIKAVSDMKNQKNKNQSAVSQQNQTNKKEAK